MLNEKLTTALGQTDPASGPDRGFPDPGENLVHPWARRWKK